MARKSKRRTKQKLTLGRTRVSRRARRIRRDFFNRQMELEALQLADAEPGDIARAEKRLAAAEQAFKSLPLLARQLEVDPRDAAAELNDEDNDGDDL